MSQEFLNKCLLRFNQQWLMVGRSLSITTWHRLVQTLARWVTDNVGNFCCHLELTRPTNLMQELKLQLDTLSMMWRSDLVRRYGRKIYRLCQMQSWLLAKNPFVIAVCWLLRCFLLAGMLYLCWSMQCIFAARIVLKGQMPEWPAGLIFFVGGAD